MTRKVKAHLVSTSLAASRRATMPICEGWFGDNEIHLAGLQKARVDDLS